MRQHPDYTTPFRRHFVFEAAFECNYDCLYCYNAWKNGRPYPARGRLGTEETLRLLDKALKESGAELVSISGGEPFLRPDIFEILEFLASRDVAVNMITNASLLDEETIERIAALGVVSIWEIPLLSAERPIHDAMTRRPGAFDASCLALARLKRAHQTVVTVFVATRMNLADLQDTLELAFALGADGFMLNRFNPGGEGCRNRQALMTPPEELAAGLDLAEAFSAEYDFPVSCSIAMPPCLFDQRRWPHLGFGFCAAGTQGAYEALDPVGNLRPCNHSMLILGNLLDHSYRELVEGEALQEFRRAQPAFCEGCAYEETCLGGCKAAAEACFGSPWDLDPYLAAFGDRARKVGPKEASQGPAAPTNASKSSR